MWICKDKEHQPFSPYITLSFFSLFANLPSILYLSLPSFPFPSYPTFHFPTSPLSSNLLPYLSPSLPIPFPPVPLPTFPFSPSFNFFHYYPSPFYLLFSCPFSFHFPPPFHPFVSPFCPFLFPFPSPFPSLFPSLPRAFFLLFPTSGSLIFFVIVFL